MLVKVPHHFKTQQGAVLAFSLVMLLLLTLAGVSMIQQNKQQLAMANNMRLITQDFADAEGKLANAKNIINTDPAHIDLTNTPITDLHHECVPLQPPTYTSDFKQHLLLAGLLNNLSGSTILSVACMSQSGTIKFCSSYNPQTAKLTCYPKSAGSNDKIVTDGSAGTDCTGKTIDQVAGLFIDSTDVCYQTYDPQCDGPCPTISNVNCIKEVYKTDVIATSKNGTTREIISDHTVICGP